MDSQNSRSGVALLGSANQDVVVAVERIPRPGETVLALSRADYAGGKGLNQGVAAARSGAAVTFLGALGTDDAGTVLEGVLAEAGIDASALRRVKEPTGQAFISVDASGENAIVVASGANATVTSLSAAERERIDSATILLMQFELPLPVVAEAAAHAHAQGVRVLVNAAPAFEIGDDVLETIDVLIVNEHEASVLSGDDDWEAGARVLATRVPQLVVTIGADGSVLYEDGQELARIPAHRVPVADTTGAGDTFCGALAAELERGAQLTEAAVFATAASALSVQRPGAVPSIPQRAEVEAFLDQERGRAEAGS